jgi:hypothetical protein
LDLSLAVRGAWLRWLKGDGAILPTGDERAEEERERAEEERERAERAEEEVARLRAELEALRRSSP